MANTNKKTINTEYTELIAIVKNANISEEEKTAKIEFLEKRIELNKKKNAGGSKKLSANQTANVALGSAIVEYLKTSGRTLSITEMIKEIPECEDLTNQKINGVIRYLYDSEKNPNPNPALIRTESKGKAYFRYNADYEVEGNNPPTPNLKGELYGR